jgi:hypothetical protein
MTNFFITLFMQNKEISGILEIWLKYSAFYFLFGLAVIIISAVIIFLKDIFE